MERNEIDDEVAEMMMSRGYIDRADTAPAVSTCAFATVLILIGAGVGIALGAIVALAMQ